MKKHFNFSRGQKIGIVSIACLILVLVLLLNVNNHLGPPEYEPVDLSDVKFENFDELSFSNSDNDAYTIGDDNDKGGYSLQDFNPNELDTKGWMEIGFSEKQASSIVKYHSNYGPFKNANDVGKIYVISSDKFEEIKPYMVFENESENADQISGNNQLIKINTATQDELQSISGIGPAYSQRIIKYRTKLGGFYSSDQFQEVYGLKDESLQALIDNSEIDSENISKMNLNSASKNELKQHPYLNKWEIISIVLKKRDQSKITDLEFLKEADGITDADILRIEPYIEY